MKYKQGEIVLVPFPFTDLTSKKTRPAIILSNKQYQGDDIILCGISSQSNDKQEITLHHQDMDEGGLPLISYIKYGKIVTIHNNLIIGKLGCISKKKLTEVLFSIQNIIKKEK